jgi:hypothetical protein
MFARFRRLHEEVNSKIISMKETSYFDVNTDLFYLRGIEKGIEKGERRGKVKSDIQNIETCIALKFDNAMIAKAMNIDLSFVEKIKKELLKKDRIIVELKKQDTDVEIIAKKLKVHPLLVEVVQEELKKKSQN